MSTSKVVGGWPVRGFLSDNVSGSGRFRPNAASAPAKAHYGGTLVGYYAVTYGATGLYTVTFVPGFRFPTNRPPTILVGCASADNTNTHRFQVNLVGDWDNTTRSFTVQARQEGTAFAVPSNAGNWIHFTVDGVSSDRKR